MTAPRRSRRERVEAGPAASIPLLSFAAGTFTRTNARHYQTAADKSVLAGVNVIRPEDLGDGNGPQVLFEGLALNRLIRSEELNNAAWVKTNCTVTQDAYVAPDSTTTAEQVTGTTAGLLTGCTQTTAAASPSAACSFWIKQGTTTGNGGQIAVTEVAGATVRKIIAAPIPTTWTRYKLECLASFTGAGNLSATVSPTSDAGGLLATGGDNLAAWGASLETGGRVVGSYTPTAAATVSGAADTLTYGTNAWPARLSSGTFAFDMYMMGSSTAYNTLNRIIFSFTNTGSDECRILPLAGIVFRVVAGGVTILTTPAFSFSDGQKITVTVRPAAGQVVIAGATTGNGTTTGAPWTWPSPTTNSLRWGGRFGSTLEASVRMSPPRTAV